MAGRWALSLGALSLGALGLSALAGCQLVVGDIELPTLIQEFDAGDDALVMDATVHDSARGDMPTPDSDMGIVDAAFDVPDLATAHDLGPDLAVDMAQSDLGPVDAPTDLRTLSGTWHLYGARGRRQNLTLFSVALNIDGDGVATLSEIGTEIPLSDIETLFDVHPDGTPRVSINLFPRAGRLAGMMDPVAGAVTFVNDLDFGDTTPTFIVGTRVNALNQLPPNLVYLDMQVEPQPGAGEGGTVARGEMGLTYTQAGRLGFDSGGMAANPPVRTLDAVYSDRQRVVLTEGEMPAEGFALSPAAGGQGAAGVYGPQDDPARLVFAWSVVQSPLYLPARFWCAGHGLDDEGNHRSLSAFASLRANGEIVWDNGGAAVLQANDDLFGLVGEENFFGHPDGFLTMDPDQRVLMLIDFAEPGFRWGMGVCVNLTAAVQ
ncbi:MAG: hypothetical protein ACI9U2_001103 [Bradymonadia bacterium]|jgi:hypothetical protein